jgi:D-glycero-D-manno-heptose 1,7-bisphosphate phosphatase
MTRGRRAVFLDRDGVLNRATVRGGRPYPPASPAEAEILPGVPEALVALRAAGFLLIVVTNQPDVARGSQRREVVEAINAGLGASLPIDGFFVSYEDGDSPRRKPNPGLLIEAAESHRVDLAASVMVGDRWKDVEAGRRAGCATVFIDLGYDEPRPEPPADYTADGLPSAASWIINASPDEEPGHGPA